MTRLSLALLSLLIFALPLQAAEPLSEKDFTAYYKKALIRHYDGKLNISTKGPLQIQLKRDIQKPLLLNLSKTYQRYQRSPGKLDSLVQRSAILAIASYEAPPRRYHKGLRAIDGHKRSHVLPLIRSRAQIEKLLPQEPVFEQLAEDLYILYTLDKAEERILLSEAAMQDLQLEKAQLRTLASKNLSRLRPAVDIRGKRAAVTALQASGDYEASTLLLNIWHRQNFPVKGDIVVYIPTQELILVTGSNDKTGLQQIKSAFQRASERWHNPITTKGYVYKNGRWQPLKP